MTDEAAAFDVDESRSKRQLSSTKAELRRALDSVEALEQRCDLLTTIDSVGRGAPRWALQRTAKKADKVGIANLFLSDLHLDEVVDPAEIGGVNAYNRKIAEKRLKRTGERFVMVAKDYLSGVDYQGACVWLGGDIFSGSIHEELARTNEASIIASVEHWLDPMVDVLSFIADEFGKVHVPGVVGNHGRNTRKPIMKGRVEDNFDWLFYRLLARCMRSDQRVSFDISPSADMTVRQFDTTYLFTHGDQFRGGSGIAGPVTPWMLGDARKRKRQNAVNQPYDVMVMGHWHSYTTLPGMIVNGSMKGYDEYAYLSNFGFEKPQQAFWVCTPEHGITFHAPVLCEDRKAEGW